MDECRHGRPECECQELAPCVTCGHSDPHTGGALGICLYSKCPCDGPIDGQPIKWTERPTVFETGQPVNDDGWDINVWVGESYELANHIFEAIAEMIEEKFDIHEPEEQCAIDWGLGMSPAKFD